MSKKAVEAKPVPVEAGGERTNLLQEAIREGLDTEALEKLMDMQERWERQEARKAFDAAMADLRADLPKIVKRREVDYTSSKGRTHYQYEDLDSVVSELAPVMAKHGLSFRWKTDNSGDAIVVSCVVSHRDGHSEETTLRATPDTSGSKNSIQAIGSTVTYLQRYTLKAAVGVAAAPDDDAQSAGEKNAPEPPEGYDSWIADMETKADDGIEVLKEAWKGSGAAFRKYAAGPDRERWDGIKAAAEKVSA